MVRVIVTFEEAAEWSGQSQRDTSRLGQFNEVIQLLELQRLENELWQTALDDHSHPALPPAVAASERRGLWLVLRQADRHSPVRSHKVLCCSLLCYPAAVGSGTTNHTAAAVICNLTSQDVLLNFFWNLPFFASSVFLLVSLTYTLGRSDGHLHFPQDHYCPYSPLFCMVSFFPSLIFLSGVEVYRGKRLCSNHVHQQSTTLSLLARLISWKSGNCFDLESLCVVPTHSLCVVPTLNTSTHWTSLNSLNVPALHLRTQPQCYGQDSGKKN